jgi:mutator protein MutT
MQEIVIGIVTRISYNKEVLLVRKRNLKGTQNWSFPGGKVKAGESVEKTVEREIQEETGIICRPLGELVNATRNWQSKDIKLRFFLCDYVSGFININEPETFSDARWVNPEFARVLIGKSAKLQIRNFLNFLLKNNERFPISEYIRQSRHVEAFKPSQTALPTKKG